MINIPTLSEIKANIIANLESQFMITIPLFGKNFLNILASVWAAKIWLVYKFMGLVQKNILPDTADSESNGGTLERFGRIKLGRNPFPATQAEYTIQLTGTVGTVIPASTTWRSDDDSLNAGFNFILDTAFTLNGTDIVTVRALTAGLDSRLNVSDTMSVTGPIAGLDRVATVLTESVSASAAETIEEYRALIIQSDRLEAQGGSAADYRLWASEAQGVVQTYPSAASGLVSQVNLYIEANTPTMVPTTTIINAVRDSIENPTTTRPARKPITAVVNYLPIVPLTIDVTIDDFVGTPANQISITNAIEEFLADVRPFIAAIDVESSRNDVFDNNKLIFIITSTVPGVVFSSAKFEVNTTTYTTFQFLNGDIPLLGNVTYNV